MLLILATALAVGAVLVLDWVVRHIYELHRAVEVRRFDRWLKKHPEV